MAPITRLEKFLNGIVYGGSVPEPPITRIETMLNDIKNGDVVSLTPITREETFLAKISGANVEIPTPITRIEMFLAKICGVEIATPSPIVRIEHWLNEWASGEDPLGTFTGAIARFFSRASKPIVKLEANFAPIQDLNGQEAPWPPGGGKNKIDLIDGTYTGLTSRTTVISGDVLTTTATGAIASGVIADLTNATNGPTYQAGTYVFTLFGWETNSTAVKANTTVRVKLSDTSTQDIPIEIATAIPQEFTVVSVRYSQSIQWNNGTYISFKLMLSEGSTVPISFAPYANICPISGHTGATVYDNGVQQWDEVFERGYYDITTGEKADGSSWRRNANMIPVKPETSYYFHFLEPSSGSFGAVLFYDQNKGLISAITSSGQVVNKSITTPSDCYYVAFYANSAWFTGEISFNYPSTDHDYHAYSGTTVAISFGTTVYGGKLTVFEDGSGQIDAEWEIKTFDGTETWSAAASGASNYYTAKIGSLNYAVSGVGISNLYPYNTINSQTHVVGFAIANSSANNRSQVNVRPENVESYSLTSFKAFLSENPIQVCYKLTTPITIPLTASQINTLVGENVVWVNDSDSISVTAYGSPIT